jgi:hypothetical protein
MRKPIVVLLLCCVALLGAACGGDDEPEVPSEVANAPDQVTGVLLDVDSESLEEITGFTLKDGDATYEILIDENVDYGFNLGHLREHLRTGDPVTVPLVVRDGKLYAAAIDDA